MPKTHKRERKTKDRTLPGFDASGNRVACVKCGVKIGKKKGQWNRTSKSYVGRCPQCGGYNTFPKYAPKAGDRRKARVKPQVKVRAKPHAAWPKRKPMPKPKSESKSELAPPVASE